MAGRYQVNHPSVFALHFCAAEVEPAHWDNMIDAVFACQSQSAISVVTAKVLVHEVISVILIFVPNDPHSVVLGQAVLAGSATRIILFASVIDPE